MKTWKRASLRWVMLSLAAAGCTGAKGKTEERKAISDFHASLSGLVAAFDGAKGGTDCQTDRVTELGGEGIVGYDIEVLRGLIEGRAVESTFPLRMSGELLRPASSIADSDVSRLARSARELKALRALAFVYGVESLVEPVVTGESPTDPSGFTAGRVSLSAVLIAYPSGEAVCPLQLEAENGETLKVAKVEGADKFSGPMEDLLQNADAELARRLRAISPMLQ